MHRTSSDGERCLANAAYQADTGKIKGGCSEHFNFSQVLRIENDHQHRWPMRFSPLTSVYATTHYESPDDNLHGRHPDEQKCNNSNAGSFPK